MNEIVSKFLLAGDEFMSEKRLTQPAALKKPGFTHNTCGPFIKNKEKKQKLKKKKEIKISKIKINLSWWTR